MIEILLDWNWTLIYKNVWLVIAYDLIIQNFDWNLLYLSTQNSSPNNMVDREWVKISEKNILNTDSFYVKNNINKNEYTIKLPIKVLYKDFFWNQYELNIDEKLHHNYIKK